MKESTIIGGFQDLSNKVNQIVKFVETLQQSIRLAFTGQEIRGASLQALLLKKGLITEAEMTEQIGETIKKMQSDAEEAAKKAAAPEIIVPTTEQVQTVTNETVPVTPPQA